MLSRMTRAFARRGWVIIAVLSALMIPAAPPPTPAGAIGSADAWVDKTCAEPTGAQRQGGIGLSVPETSVTLSPVQLTQQAEITVPGQTFGAFYVYVRNTEPCSYISKIDITLSTGFEDLYTVRIFEAIGNVVVDSFWLGGLNGNASRTLIPRPEYRDRNDVYQFSIQLTSTQSSRAGQTVTLVAQGVHSPLTCTYTLPGAAGSFLSAGGTGTVQVNASYGCCAWTAVSNVEWITVTSGGSGSGYGTVGYVVAANRGPKRTGTLTIAGQTFTVPQEGAPAVQIQLTTGWNLISVPLPLLDPSVGAVFAANPDVTRVSSFQNGDWLLAVRAEAGWSGGLTHIVDGRGYFVYAVAPTAVALQFAATASPFPPILPTGWNLIGYTSPTLTATRAVDSYLGRLSGKWQSLYRFDPVKGWELARPSGIGFAEVELGRGYWLDLSAPGVLVP